MASSFKNRDGKTYSLSISVAGFEAVKDQFDVDLFDLDSISSLSQDMMKALKVIHVLSVPKALFQDMPQESFETFAAAFDGDSIEDASNAFMRELLTFLPSSTGDSLRVILDRFKEHQVTADKALETILADFID